MSVSTVQRGNINSLFTLDRISKVERHNYTLFSSTEPKTFLSQGTRFFIRTSKLDEAFVCS